MNLGLVILIAWIGSAAVMSAVWLGQRRHGNAGWVDVAWAALTGACGLFYALVSTGDPVRRAVVAGMIGLWSIRLTSYLWIRVSGEEEDGRYQGLREKWGDRQQSRLMLFFQMQALTTALFAFPVLSAARAGRAFGGGWDVAGVILWSVSLTGISVADWQLKRFKRRDNTQGKTCREGLWRYSRHPNYFFEWLHWCSYVPLAIGGPLWWLTPFVPAVLLYFILFVTGIPPTEEQALRSRGDDYRRYQQTTSPFIPWFPRSVSDADATG